MNKPITQSKLWQTLQEDLGEVSFYQKGNGYYYLAILKETPMGNYLYLPYGPVTADKSGFDNALKSLKTLAKKQKAIFIRIEPQNSELNPPSNSHKSKDLNPKDTWLLDLTKDQSEIIKNFSRGTRTRFNTYAKKGLVVKKTKDPSEIKHLIKLQNVLAKAKHINTFSENYLKTELKQPFATLYLVEYDPKKREETQPEDISLPQPGEIIAASLFFDYKDTRYYMQSAANSTYRSLPATVALLTEAIFDAKEKGLKFFDFWGIAPDDAPQDHPWKGFTEFKKSFGGYPAHYVGTHDVVLNPVRYKLYKFLRKLNRHLRHN